MKNKYSKYERGSTAKLKDSLKGKDKETFQIVSNFSKINYEFIVSLRSKH